MKKLLVIAPYNYLPWFSGGQKSIAQFLEYLGRETDLTVITVPQNDFSLVKNYRTLPLLKRSFRRYADASLVSGITSLVKSEKFDAVIWEHPYFAWLAWLVKKRTGIKTIFHIHNIEYHRFHTTGRWWWPILKMYEKWSFRLADHLLFVAPEDKDFAIQKWKIHDQKCIEVAFGVEIREYPADKSECRQKIQAAHYISQHECILFFNGLLDYKPNLDALKIILNEINPLFILQPSFHYKIIICGKRLPKEMHELKDYAASNIIYAGYVDDIEMYFKGADLFLNPVQSGGGVKTKMVESIAFGTTVIATKTAAAGIKRAICGSKLVVVPDNDWKAFAEAVIQNAYNATITPKEYYEYYYWGNIVKKIARQLLS